MLQLQNGGRRGASFLVPRQGRDAKEEVAESAQVYIGNNFLFQPHYPWTVLHGGAAQHQTATAAASYVSVCTGLPRHSERNERPASLEVQPTTSTKSVTSDSYCKQFISERHVQSIHNGISVDVADCNGTESEEDRVLAITKIVLKLMKKMVDK
jgi:hypothetical protein